LINLSFQHFTEISNGFMTSATITKRLREDLNLDVHPSTVTKARKHVLGYITIDDPSVNHQPLNQLLS
jgi:hypothetical protein